MRDKREATQALNEETRTKGRPEYNQIDSLKKENADLQRIINRQQNELLNLYRRLNGGGCDVTCEDSN